VGKIESPKPVKLFAGLITNEPALIEEAGDLLSRKFGAPDIRSDMWDFSFTAYYNKEMGEGLKRKFLAFERLVSIKDTAAIKVFTNKVEERFSRQGKRRINIDPGYLSIGKLVLLTTKDYYHRIYLGRGIYAEVTLYYKGDSFQPLEWTYPDYKTKEYIDFFNSVRKTLKC
jgi:hypothetical protein